ncbi:MAG: APC family permease, partial [Chloroflexota bacterium]|nr:APC family permease [Chloroflexota bacterium]
MPDSNRSETDKREQVSPQSPAERNGPNGADPSISADLTKFEMQRGKARGDAYVRIVRSDSHLLRRVAPGYLRATEQVLEPHGRIAHWLRRVKEFAVGKRLPTIAEKEERLTKVKALAVFSSDAISSSAYATEEILIVLVTAGALGLTFALPIALGIAFLLAVVSFSYRQTVHAYPHGGGSYTVSKENLGTQAGLVAASALLIDYVLTVAVSIAAGTAAITSVIQPLLPYRVEISVAFIGIITLINLRGIRESGTIFALPTYLFIFSLASVIVIGIARLALGDAPEVVLKTQGASLEPVTLFLILHAFAAGSVAMSGTEAISNGVPAFKPPESRNAAATLIWMSSFLGFFFVGVTFLANRYGIVPSESETVISQVGRTVLGNGIPYEVFQGATMLILVLAANTSFADFPRLSSVLARDGFMPRQLSFRGDRLAFSNGIVILGVVAATLTIVFGGSTHALIPLYAVGVFISFTFSQAGMVRHWWKTRAEGWRKSLVINAFGALLTGIVLIVVGSVKFQLGAWMVFVLIPILVFIFNAIQRHYRYAAEQLGLDRVRGTNFTPPRQIVVVPIGDINQASLRAIAF